MTLLGALVVFAAGVVAPLQAATLASSVVTAICLLFGATLAAWFVLGRALRPLAQLADAADEISGSWKRKSVSLVGEQAEVQRAREALNRALTRLHECQQSLEMFVENVAHELQDPVTTILVEAQFLAERAQSPAAMASFVRSTRDEVSRIGKIISGSRTLARLDSAQPHEALGSISIVDIALEVVKNARARADELEVRLVLTLPDSDELDMRGDAELVTSMLDNIVSNAVGYSPPGEVIRIALERAAEHLEIKVRDRGPGIPELLLPHVLHPHVHGARKSHGARGRGLGLAIASRVARYHGGAIRIGNHSEGGCEVVITLPLEPTSSLQATR